MEDYMMLRLVLSGRGSGGLLRVEWDVKCGLSRIRSHSQIGQRRSRCPKVWHPEGAEGRRKVEDR